MKIIARNAMCCVVMYACFGVYVFFCCELINMGFQCEYF